MASLTLRNIDEGVKARLRIRAAEHGRSMEDEARHILKDALEYDPPRTLADLALELFGPKHGIELELNSLVEDSEPPKFDSAEFDP